MGSELSTYPCCLADDESNVEVLQIINMELKERLLLQKKAYHQLRVQNQHEQKKKLKQWSDEKRQQDKQMLALTQQNEELQHKLQQKYDVSQSVSDSVDFVRIN